MPHAVSQASTQGFYIFADDADSYGEGLSGLSISVSLSKGGGAFNAVSPTITDRGDGVYWVAPSAAHRDTLGEIAWRFGADGAVIAPRFERVVAVNDQVAQWGVPDAVLAAAAATPIRADMRLINGEPPQPLGYEPAKEETVQEVLGAVGTMTAEAVRVPSPNVRGNLNLVSGDTYDGIANAKPSWIVAADYTDGWSVALTIRSENDEVVLTAAGEVESAALVSVGLVGPAGLEFEGCPGVWQGKYDVQLSKGESRKTIAVGACYVTEDQTR